MASHTRSARRRFGVSTLILLLGFVPACGGSSPSAPTPTPSGQTPQTTTITYSGTFQNSDGSFGSITVSSEVASTTAVVVDGSSHPRAVATATGVLKPGGGGSIPLTGSYDTVTKRFTLTGGPFAVSAAVSSTGDGNVLNGSITSPSTQGAVLALPPPASGALINYCGNYTGDTRGSLVMTRRDAKLFALVSEQGAAADFSITGTLTGNDVYFKFDYQPPDVGSTTVTGTLSGSTMSGTWVANYVEAGRAIIERGDWTVRAGSCPL